MVRRGILLAVPEDYAMTEEHQALVARLSTNSYLEAVTVLETVTLSNWLAADVLTGAVWARRYLNTMAKLWVTDQKLARRGSKALLRILSGHEAKLGRHPDGPLSPESAAKAASALAGWRALVDAEWAGERSGLATRLIQRAGTRIPLSAAHRRAIRVLTRRPRLRKGDVALTFTSWETGIPIRRIRSVSEVASLVYG